MILTAGQVHEATQAHLLIEGLTLISLIADKRSSSAEDRLPKSLHFAESDVIIGVVRVRSVHKVGYGHK
jgi:hypothetical protein